MDKRIKKILEYAKDNLLNLGGIHGNLDKILRENFKQVKTADLEGGDYVIDLNDKEWNINKKFDCIVAGEILEHIEKPIQFLTNCYNLLNEQGILILTTPNATSLVYLRNPNWCVGYETDFDDLGHIHAFTSGMLVNLFNKVGFKIESFHYINAFVNHPFYKLISFLFKRLRGDLLIVGIKE